MSAPQAFAISNRRVEGLDVLRLFAAVLVVLYHYTFHGPGAYDLTWVSLPAVAPVTKYFYLGVPLFFVISGFVIAYSAHGRSVREFAVARVSRIYPGFLLCMTLTYLIVAMFGDSRLGVTAFQWAANLVIAAPALKQPYMDLVYWSIVVEVIFYALAASAMAFGLFERRLPLVVTAWLAVSVLNEMVLNSEVVRRILITNYSGFFSSGIMLYGLFRGQRGVIGWCLGLAIIVGALQVEWNADWLRERDVELSHFVVPLLGLLAPAVTAVFVFAKVSWPSRAALALGGLTYPLYLIHQMVGYVIFNRLEGSASAALLIPAVLFAMVAVSWGIYQLVERPAQQQAKALLLWMLKAEGSRRALDHSNVKSG